jgi:hypothetical protein
MFKKMCPIIHFVYLYMYNQINSKSVDYENFNKKKIHTTKGDV